MLTVKDKPTALATLQQHLQQPVASTAFLGDDLNDLAVRPRVGLLLATADAARPLRRQADLVLRSRGGHGAVRELAERLLAPTPLGRRLAREGWRDRND